MKIWKTKIWTPIDLVLAKWSTFLFGMIVGSFVPNFTRQYIWFVVIAMVLLAIKPVTSYLSDKE